ncbi:plasmid mobilization protein [Hominenteromicrobium sp.]|uniref:plasmid mobilization protein n=1 Tax=Oscillospiraceae TaxID=216572 RepID=UPI003993B9CF
MQKGEKKYPKRVEVKMDNAQFEKLGILSKKAGLTKSAYIRRMIDGVVPQERPPYDFYKILTQMRYISNSMNQLAKKANATGHVDAEKISLLAEQFKPLASQLYLYVTLPVKRSKDTEILAEYFKKEGG